MVKYPKDVKEKALARMMAPTNEPVAKLSRELNVSPWRLYTWRKEALQAGVVAPGDGRNPEAWSGKAKLAVVLETAALSEAELGEYCRAKGLYPEQVRGWLLPAGRIWPDISSLNFPGLHCGSRG